MGYAGDYSLNELLVVAAARELRDGELGFVGVGTAGRAFTLAVGIPIAAARLAQMTHAPNFTIYWGNLLSPDLNRIPPKLTQHHVTTWPCAAQLANTGDKCDMLARRQFDVCFDSAPQIDRFGNLNITAIGEYRRPKARLIGCLAQTDHFAFVKSPHCAHRSAKADASSSGWISSPASATSMVGTAGSRPVWRLGGPGR